MDEGQPANCGEAPAAGKTVSAGSCAKAAGLANVNSRLAQSKEQNNLVPFRLFMFFSLQTCSRLIRKGDIRHSQPGSHLTLIRYPQLRRVTGAPGCEAIHSLIRRDGGIKWLLSCFHSTRPFPTKQDGPGDLPDPSSISCNLMARNT